MICPRPGRIFLSTPSARRATVSNATDVTIQMPFLSTPSARRATQWMRDPYTLLVFLSTPSARRATADVIVHIQPISISIHALREEGDFASRRLRVHDEVISIHALREEGDQNPNVSRPSLISFLSTPSARRATPRRSPQKCARKFLSTPSARRATFPVPQPDSLTRISIHALREEGDGHPRLVMLTAKSFLSTPSARRATYPINEDTAKRAFLSTPSARRATG